MEPQVHLAYQQLTDYLIDNSDGKIIFGWKYEKSFPAWERRKAASLLAQDFFNLKPKYFSFKTARALKALKINPHDKSNWK